VNPVDAIVLVLMIVAVFLGVRSGAIPQLAGLGGAALGAGAGFLLLPAATPVLDGLDPTLRSIVVLGALFALVGIGEGLGAAAGRAASRALGQGFLGALDQLAGGLVGLGQTVLIVWLAGGVLASGPFPKLSQLAQTSTAVRIVDDFLPPPTEIVGELGRLLDNTGLPDVFIGLEQLPAPAIDLPSDAQAGQIGSRAAASVLRVIADGCDARASGSAFVVKQGYLVTNAHVVVGASAIAVQNSTGSFQATPVLVDLDLDIAVLHVSRLNAPALAFTSAEPERGAIGATFGFPGGGNAAVEPATVAATYSATGRDVTGTTRVTRRIVELRSRVVPGDSGGPFLLADGTVGGVVFAQSRADPLVGYALSPIEVADRIGPALSRVSEVATGPCRA
jgi:S1-C subfamily serine protease